MIVSSDAEEYASTLVKAGFLDRDEVLAAVADSYQEELSDDEAEELVDRLWQARLAEQAGWPERTDADRVLAALADLDARGIVARTNFTCCTTCGVAEIGDEAGENPRGFAFFHQQDTERAVAGGGLYLSYGTFGPGDAAAVGREVADTLTAHDLPVVWDGSPGTCVLVTPLTWQLRLE